MSIYEFVPFIKNKQEQQQILETRNQSSIYRSKFEKNDDKRFRFSTSVGTEIDFVSQCLTL